MDWLRRIFQIGSPSPETPITFFNTLGKSLQEFSLTPRKKVVRMYNCGPTVYDRQHIGNMSAAVFADTLRRVLEFNDYEVKQVINITDFGHLSGDNEGDADVGEDRITKGMKRDKIKLSMENMREFTTKYMQMYLEDISRINIATEKIRFPRASDYVPAMIAMIQSLEEKGYAYKIDDGVYFDTKRFPHYGALGNIELSGLQEGARVESNQQKRSAHDFALWKSTGSRSKLGWDSPWGKGFPGWHLECSAMIHSLLGDQIDIHTGGIEHIAIHHNNEIAQSEAATGKRPLARFWLHREHIRMGNAKLAKSTGNTAYISDLIDKGLHPLSLRYWFLTAHYRQPANFTWEALEAAQKAYLRLRDRYAGVKSSSASKVPRRFLDKFKMRVNDDMDTPGAIALVWETLKDDELRADEIKAILKQVDTVLGLGLEVEDEMLKKLSSTKETIDLQTLPQDVKKLIEERRLAREAKDWSRSDALRKEVEGLGYNLEDKPTGLEIRRK